MIAHASPIVVRQYASTLDFERRHGDRQDCTLDVTTRPLEAPETLVWGATVRDISHTGIGLTLCYPFKAGTYLALDIHGNPASRPATVLTRVVHSRDQNDGSWHVGCEFLKPLNDSDLKGLV